MKQLRAHNCAWRVVALLFTLALAACSSTPTQRSQDDPVPSRFGPGAGGRTFSSGFSLIKTEVTDTSLRIGARNRRAAPTTSANQTDLSFSLGLGYYFTAVQEAGFTARYSKTDDDTGTEFSVVFLEPYYNYNWQSTPRTWFYGGPHLGIAFLEADGIDDSGLSLGLHVGMRHWLTPRASFFVEPRFTNSDNSTLTVDETAILMGFSVLY